MELNGKYLGQYECSFGEEAIFTIIKRGSELIAGGLTNAGFYDDYIWECDKNLTQDRNISDFLEYIDEAEKKLI